MCAEETSALSEVRALRLRAAASRVRAPRCCRRRAAARADDARAAVQRGTRRRSAPAAGLADGVRRAPALGSLTAQVRARPARRRRARGGAAEPPRSATSTCRPTRSATTAAAPSRTCCPSAASRSSSSAPTGRRPRRHPLAHALTRRRAPCALAPAPTASATAARRRSPRRSARRGRRATVRSRRSTSATTSSASPASSRSATPSSPTAPSATSSSAATRARRRRPPRHRHARRAQPREGTRDGERGVSAALIEPNAAASELVRVRVQQLYTNAYDVAEGVEDDAAAGGDARPGAVVAARLAARDAEREKVAAALRSTQMALERAALDVGALRSEGALDTTLRRLLVDRREAHFMIILLSSLCLCRLLHLQPHRQLGVEVFAQLGLPGVRLLKPRLSAISARQHLRFSASSSQLRRRRRVGLGRARGRRPSRARPPGARSSPAGARCAAAAFLGLALVGREKARTARWMRTTGTSARVATRRTSASRRAGGGAPPPGASRRQFSRGRALGRRCAGARATARRRRPSERARFGRPASAARTSTWLRSAAIVRSASSELPHAGPGPFRHFEEGARHIGAHEFS